MAPMPLPVLSNGIQQPVLDIVSIPGLPTLHPEYKLKDHNNWLREVLSHQVPQARIMALQYDFAKELSKTSWAGLTDQAQTLLYSLSSKREEAPNRPMIFVCYSFGSIILKKALVIAKTNSSFRDLFDSTRGVIFIACIHDEGYPTFEDVSIKCATVEFGSKKKHEAVEALKKSKDEDWNAIKDVVEKFRLLRCRIPVRILYERKMTPCATDKLSLFKSRKSEWLCSDSVSSLGWENEELIGVDKDHTELTMYPHRGDSQGFFETFIQIIRKLVEEVCPPVPQPVYSTDQQDEADWDVIVNNTTNVHLSMPSSTHLDDSISNRSMMSTFDHVPIVNLPCYVMTPFEVNPDFEGRDTTLQKIHETLDPSNDGPSKGRKFVVAGLGGMGKTQVALSYAFLHRKKYQVILCADADGKAKLADSFIHFAAKLGLGDGLTSITAKQMVRDCLQGLNDPWLIIFDNADGDDKHDLLREYCPEVGLFGSVLITSRDITLLNQNEYDGVELTELTEEESVNLLLKLTSQCRAVISASEEEKQQAAQKIVYRLGYLPLGITQAASLVKDISCSLPEFLEAFDNRNIIKDFQDKDLQQSQSSYKYSLSTVWNMNFERLGDDEKSLINLISFLDPDMIQMSVLKDGVVGVDNTDFALIGTPLKLIKCRGELLRSTLISQSANGQEIRMHRLVQASCQLRMNPEEQRLHFARAVRLLINVWPVPERISVHNPALWKQQRMLLPHVQSICESYRWSCSEGQPLIEDSVVSWEFAKLLYEAGWFCYESGLLECVYNILKPAEEYCLKHLSKGGGYRVLADIYGGLGSLWTESNEFQKAFDDFSEQWKYIQLAFEHNELQKPSIWEVYGLGRLGNGHHGLHRYQEAEEYYRDCLEAWKHLPGDRKIYTTHLATCLWLQGRPDEGEAVLRPIIKDWDDTSNFRTGMAIYSLGNIQIAQATELTQNGQKEKAAEKFSEAMEAHMQALKLWQKTLGSKHHKTADAMHKVAWHYHRNQSYDRAIILLESALDVYEGQPKIFKNEIARTKYKLGCVLQDRREHVKGGELIRIAESMRKEIVPPENWEPATGEEDFDEIVQFWTR